MGVLLGCIKACTSEQKRAQVCTCVCHWLSNWAQRTITLCPTLFSVPRGCSFRKHVLGAQLCPRIHLSPARCPFPTSNIRASVNASEIRHTIRAGSSAGPSVPLPLEAQPPQLPLYSLSLDLQVFMARVAHFTEARHEEIIAPMVGWGVLLYVGKLHKLCGGRGEIHREMTRHAPRLWALGPGIPQALCRSKATRKHILGTMHLRIWL